MARTLIPARARLPKNLAAMPGVPRGLDPGAIEEDLEHVDLTADDKRVLLKVVRATKQGRPAAALPLSTGE